MFGTIEDLIRSNCTAFLSALLIVTAPTVGAQVNGNQGATGRPKERPSSLVPFRLPGGGSVSTHRRNLCGSVPDKPCISRKTMRDLQVSLNALGFEAGPADGIFGLRTSRALNAYRSANGILASGYPRSTEAEAIISTARKASGSMTVATASSASANTDDKDPGPDAWVLPGAGIAGMQAESPGVAPVPTRVFAGPGQFPPSRFRGYGFLAFPALASEYDYDRHMKICQAYVNSLPATSSVKQQREDQFVTVWPIKDERLANALNGLFHRHEAAAYCSQAIDHYDDGQARDVMAKVRLAQDVTLDGRGPYLFGWIPADEYGQTAKFILNLDLSRVTTYEQALVQLQSWQQKIATNPELLRDGLSVENMRRTIRDWSDQHGQAFLMLIGAG